MDCSVIMFASRADSVAPTERLQRGFSCYNVGMHLTADQRRGLLDLARHEIRSALGVGGDLAPPPLLNADPSTDPLLPHQPAGCFVTLHMLGTHRLRGCVGRLDARDPLAEAVRQAALSVLKDPRFVNYPVRREDLPRMEIEITVICPLRPCDHPSDFTLENDGIYLTVGDRSGCFLPQVARETGWSREQLLSRLCTEKLGLAPDAWRDPEARLMKFETVLVGPEPFDV
jgi:AmmeMemoRadiSam system protein A